MLSGSVATMLDLSPSVALAAAAALLLVGGSTSAQEIASDDVSPVACGAKAALFATGPKGPRLWVVRHGEMQRDNPLRPLTPDRLVVLEVVVNNRLATAYGPDHGHLRQGGALRDLEQEAVEPIRWRAGPDGLPAGLRIVGEDGSVLLDGLRFLECADAPKARAVPSAQRVQGSDRPDRKAAEERSRRRQGLPQGAMEGLSLPGR